MGVRGGAGNTRASTGLWLGARPRDPLKQGESPGGRAETGSWSGANAGTAACACGSRPPGEPRDDLGTWRGCGGTGTAGWGLSGWAEQAGSLEESRNPGIGECLRGGAGGAGGAWGGEPRGRFSW